MEGTAKKTRTRARKTKDVTVPSTVIKAEVPGRPVIDKKVENPAIKAIIPPEKYVVTANASTMLNDSYVMFTVGDIVEDYSTIKALKTQGATFIRKLDDASIIVPCPHCGKKVVIDAPVKRDKSL